MRLWDKTEFYRIPTVHSEGEWSPQMHRSFRAFDYYVMYVLSSHSARAIAKLIDTVKFEDILFL